MSQEYDCNEPPYEVLLRIFIQWCHHGKARRKVSNVVAYVPLVSLEIGLVTPFYGNAFVYSGSQYVQRINETRHAAEIRMAQGQVARPALCQHLSYSLLLLLLSLP